MDYSFPWLHFLRYLTLGKYLNSADYGRAVDDAQNLQQGVHNGFELICAKPEILQSVRQLGFSRARSATVF